jgi:hypothetical protein
VQGRYSPAEFFGGEERMERILIYAILIVFLLVVVLAFMDYMVLLNMKFEMNALCRGALLTMETKGYLSGADISELEGSLADRGFTGIYIRSLGGTAQGDRVSLQVEADYIYRKMTNVFSRSDTVQRMSYDKTSVVRRVVN